MQFYIGSEMPDDVMEADLALHSESSNALHSESSKLATFCHRVRVALALPEWPSCRVPVTIDEGCTQMHYACGHKWCYVCKGE